MKIIPVIDVLGGLVVHAVKGERQHYKPLKSVICRSTNPIEVAKAFEGFGFREIYLADLDAILGRSRSYALYRQIKAETRLKLMVDAATSDVISASKVLSSGVDWVIVGTETLTSLDALSETVKVLGSEHVVVSLDVKGGQLISRSAEVRGLNPLELAKRLEGMGVKFVILLDLDRVGMECGVNLNLLETLLGGTGLKVMVGGGLSSVKELCILREIGAYGVLLATALHYGKLDIGELKSRRLL
ncbi:hypothetical protein KEJ15_05635 [Candidatus Bathyarchaeota archaeon]|nr:hypothetical protein [Candidatus Bathyarchaeota archaeon]